MCLSLRSYSVCIWRTKDKGRLKGYLLNVKIEQEQNDWSLKVFGKVLWSDTQPSS